MTTESALRVLYVEDEPDIRAVAKIALETVGGLKLKICASGQEALDTASAFAPDIILLDVMMPGLDGPSTLVALRGLPETKETAIVFMTAKVQAQDIVRYKEMGAVDVISKPFDPMTLAAKVRNIWAALKK